MLIVPRNIQAPYLLRRGMPTIFFAPGDFSTGAFGEFSIGEVGIFKPAETGEYSTGVDIGGHVYLRDARSSGSEEWNPNPLPGLHVRRPTWQSLAVVGRDG